MILSNSFSRHNFWDERINLRSIHLRTVEQCLNEIWSIIVINDGSRKVKFSWQPQWLSSVCSIGNNKRQGYCSFLDCWDSFLSLCWNIRWLEDNTFWGYRPQLESYNWIRSFSSSGWPSGTRILLLLSCRSSTGTSLRMGRLRGVNSRARLISWSRGWQICNCFALSTSTLV